MYIDAAVHIWSNDPAQHPWFPDSAPYRPSESATPEQLLAVQGAAGFAGAVCVQPIVYGTDHRYLSEVLSADPGRFAGVCRVDRFDPATPRRLRELVTDEGFGGVRLLCYRDASPWIAAPEVDEIWKVAADLGIVVYVMARPDQLYAVSARARQFPDLTLAIDHLGLVRGDAEPEALAALIAVAERPNVVVKASALGYLSAQSWPYPDVGPVLRATYAAFGPERILYGSDWPVSLAHCSYTESLAAFTDALRLSDSARDLVFGGNVRRLFPGLARTSES